MIRRTIGERVYPVRFFALGDRVPVVVAPSGAGLDTPLPELGEDGRRRSAFGLLQEYLNASGAALWGLAADGFSLRIARDNASLTRPAWIEADLARIFTEDLYPDFAALWLFAHESRFGRAGDPPEACPLEVWREAGRQEGTRARDKLSEGFRQALRILGQGFLSHPANRNLRTALRVGNLTKDGYFGQLLRLVYRLVFLLTVEERNLLHPQDASDPARRLHAHRDTVSAAFAIGPFAGAPTTARAISGRRSESSSGASRVASRGWGSPPSPVCSRGRNARTSTRRSSRTARSSAPSFTSRGFGSPRGSCA